MHTISLLHATYRSSSGPLQHRNLWLSQAEHPDRINYVVAMEDTDESAILETDGMVRAINHPRDTLSTAVQNWNSAARLSSGELLFVISDDLLPPRGWDVEIDAVVGTRNPITDHFAVKIQDSPTPYETTLRHPVISRGFYESYGLFDDSFRGVFCDNDITFRALLHSNIIDGRAIVFAHAHPHFDPSQTETESQRRINRSEEYEFGRRVFLRKYSPFHYGLNLNDLDLSPNRGQQSLPLKVRRAGIRFKGKFLRALGRSTELS